MYETFEDYGSKIKCLNLESSTLENSAKDKNINDVHLKLEELKLSIMLRNLLLDINMV